MQLIPINNPDNLPIIRPLPKPLPRPADGAIAICGECHRRILAVDCYSCPRSNCPVYPRVTC